MFHPSRTHQYNLKFPKIPLKLNVFESVIYDHVYRIRQFQCIFLKTLKMKKYFIKNYDLPGNKFILYRTLLA